MDMGFDSKTQQTAPGRYDWHGLRARFAAGQALRSMPERGETAQDPVAGGSFDRRSARLIAVYGRGPGGGSDGVNPNASGNGNPTCDNDAAFIGALSAGD